MKAPFVKTRPAGIRIVAAVLVRPYLWGTAVGVIRSHFGAGNESRRTWRPNLGGEYLAFRMETQYGDSRKVTAADASDVVKYLEWVKDWKARR